MWIVVPTIGFLVAAAYSWRMLSFVSSPADRQGQEVFFEVQNGASFSHVARELRERGLITDARLFTWLARFLGQTSRLKVGEYKLNTNMYPRQILFELTSGRSVIYALTIPEGHNIYEIRDQLNSMWAGRGEEFIQLATNKEFIQQLTHMPLPNLEGYLFPETYSISKHTPARTLINQMYESFRTNIEQANKEPKVTMALREQVILASMIEKETGAPEERPLISSVFHNRLKKGMRLQSDPTILYGSLVVTGVVKKNIVKKDLSIPTPYNTYTVKALPLGPIANPGRDALWAAVHPADSNYLYFVSRNDGTHVFTENYKDHERAVRDYQINRKAREGRSWRELKSRKARN